MNTDEVLYELISADADFIKRIIRKHGESHAMTRLEELCIKYASKVAPNLKGDAFIEECNSAVSQIKNELE